MQQLPENRTLRTGMSRETAQQHKKIKYLKDMTSEEDQDESEICRITQINKILPENNEHYGTELKINETTKFHH